MKTEYTNPYISEQKIKAFRRNDQFLHNGINSESEILNKPKVINASYYVDASPRISVFTDAQMRKIYYNLSLPTFFLLHYIQGIIRFNEDLIKINVVKFQTEAGIKSRTTVYKAIDELCGHNFITPFSKRTYYWINPHRFFKGDRTHAYKGNLDVIGKAKIDF